MDEKKLDRISYALGLSMGNNFLASGRKTIDVQDFADGVAAVFNGLAPKMSYDEAKEEIRVYFEAMQKEQEAAAAGAKQFSAQSATCPAPFVILINCGVGNFPIDFPF